MGTTPALPYILNLKKEEIIMGKASKAFNKIDSDTPRFKPRGTSIKREGVSSYNMKAGKYAKEGNKPVSKPKLAVWEGKPRVKQNQQQGTSIDKRLHTLFMSTKGHTLLFKRFSTVGGEDLPIFNKLIVRNSKNTKGENVFSYYLYDANYNKRIENWDADLEIKDVVFYSDTNVKFTLNSGATLICEQIISKKFIEEKFQEFVMGKKPTAKG